MDLWLKKPILCIWHNLSACWKTKGQNPGCFRKRNKQRRFLSSLLLLACLFLLSMASSTSSNQLNSSMPHALHLSFTSLPSSSHFSIIFLISSYPISRACHVRVQTAMASPDSMPIPLLRLCYFFRKFAKFLMWNSICSISIWKQPVFLVQQSELWNADGGSNPGNYGRGVWNLYLYAWACYSRSYSIISNCPCCS